MKKKLFQNYNFSFDKNERKLIKTICRQALKQIEGNDQYFGEVKAFNSVLDKINSDAETIKLTKDEKTRFSFLLKQNIDSVDKQMNSSIFIKKWLMKSLYNQYTSLYNQHFKG